MKNQMSIKEKIAYLSNLSKLLDSANNYKELLLEEVNDYQTRLNENGNNEYCKQLIQEHLTEINAIEYLIEDLTKLS